MTKKPPEKVRPFPPVLDLKGVKLKIDFQTIHNMPNRRTAADRDDFQCARRGRP